MKKAELIERCIKLEQLLIKKKINLEEFDKVKPLASFNNDEKNVKIVVDFSKYKDYTDEETI
jgi:uncharacterized protein YabE (DUF348 family)